MAGYRRARIRARAMPRVRMRVNMGVRVRVRVVVRVIVNVRVRVTPEGRGKGSDRIGSVNGTQIRVIVRVRVIRVIRQHHALSKSRKCRQRDRPHVNVYHHCT